MYFPFHTKHAYTRVPSLNCRYSTVEFLCGDLEARVVGTGPEDDTADDGMLNSRPIPIPILRGASICGWRGARRECVIG